VTTPFCRIRNLVIGREYEFRVMAENQYGTSDPALTADPVKARHPFGMWTIFTFSPAFCCFRKKSHVI
jgi:hypothetical protein